MRSDTLRAKLKSNPCPRRLPYRRLHLPYRRLHLPCLRHRLPCHHQQHPCPPPAPLAQGPPRKEAPQLRWLSGQTLVLTAQVRKRSTQPVFPRRESQLRQPAATLLCISSPSCLPLCSLPTICPTQTGTVS